MTIGDKFGRVGTRLGATHDIRSTVYVGRRFIFRLHRHTWPTQKFPIETSGAPMEVYRLPYGSYGNL